MKTRQIVMTGMMLALALVFQIGFRQFAQPLVGPLVNMTLILTTLYVGASSGVLVGIITPVIALMMGIIGMPLLVPFIAIGNCLLVVAFDGTNKLLGKIAWKHIPAVAAGAIFKFIFLYIGVRYLLSLFIPKVPAPLLSTFGIAQLYTALVGGSVAIILYRLIPSSSFGHNVE